MGYEKQNWTTGEVITADKLNHMEDGIGSNLELIALYTSSVTISGLTPKTLSYGECAITLNQTIRESIGDKKVIYFYITGLNQNSYIIDPLISYEIGGQSRGMNLPNWAHIVNHTNEMDDISEITIQGLFYNANEYAPMVLGVFAMCK